MTGPQLSFLRNFSLTRHTQLDIFSVMKQVAKRNGHFGKSKKPGKLNGLRVGIMAKPCAEFVASVWATWLNGAVAVPLALSYPEAELAHVLTDAVRFFPGLLSQSQNWRCCNFVLRVVQFFNH